MLRCMTDFLPRHISVVARTGRTEQASSDEGLRQRPKHHGKNVGCVWIRIPLGTVVGFASEDYL